MRAKTAWVSGGSGLVGGELLKLLLEDRDFTTVISVGRRTLPLQRLELRQVVVDFADPASLASLASLDPPDVAFSCLGTTIKKAGSPEAFRAVDHDAVVAFAKAARQKGARSFIHVSSAGADARSGALYMSVKGQVEQDVAALGFDSVYALRPSILDGERKDSRPLEAMGLAIGRAMGPLLGKYRPTPARAVAAAMVDCCKHPDPGAHVMEADVIWKRFAR